MCGIWAIFGLDTDCLPQSGTASTNITHRGSETLNVQYDSCIKECCMGVHRLTIVDNTYGVHSMKLHRYPFSVLTFNGELYNCKSLAKQFGFEYETGNDVEWLYHLYQTKGIDECVKNLNGIFAFSILDTTNKRVMLVRDSDGARPLFRLFSDSGVLAASSRAKDLIEVSEELNGSGWKLEPLPPGTFEEYELLDNGCVKLLRQVKYHTIKNRPDSPVKYFPKGRPDSPIEDHNEERPDSPDKYHRPDSPPQFEQHFIPYETSTAIPTVIPSKSKIRYEMKYKQFEDWSAAKHINDISENVLLQYFSEKSQIEKSSTLWTHYSMLKSVISMKRNIDISKFIQLTAFLKKISQGYSPKKSKIFTKEEIKKFLVNADDEHFLMLKVVLIIGVFGACRREEFVRLKVSDIDDRVDFIKIVIPCTNKKMIREFAITEGNIPGINCLHIFRKYADLRPITTKHDRFFISYRNARCTIQPVGINTFGNIPKLIAKKLNLINPEQYTGHCFRRSSASLLDNADIYTIKRHGGWKSSKVAEEYVETSMEDSEESEDITQKSTEENEITSIGKSIVNYVASTSGLQISNCKQLVINVYNQ